jgi:hypothetical protein
MSFSRAVAQWANATPPKTRVVWLGLCCWVVTGLLPALHRAPQQNTLSWALLALAPLLLAVGLALFRPYPDLAAYVLLCGFPIALAISMSRLEHELALITYSPISLAFSLLTLGAYAASASQMGALHEPERSVEHKPLGEVPPVDTERRRQRLGLVALSVVTLGSIVNVLWGSFQSPADYREDWGRAAPSGAVLSALLAGLLGCLTIAFIAPALRAERRRGKREAAKYRKVMRPLIAAATLVALYFIARSTR